MLHRSQLAIYLFDFPYKITKIINKLKKKNQTHDMSWLVDVEYKIWNRGFVFTNCIGV